MTVRLPARLGAHPVSVWTIKHVINPLDRLAVRLSGGRLAQPSSLVLPTVLLTVVGRRSGTERTLPLVFVPDGESFVVANARPAGERRNPWVANMRAAGAGLVRVQGRTHEVCARELHGEELDRWWPELVDVWPAFSDHYAATGERAVFRLTPT